MEVIFSYLPIVILTPPYMYIKQYIHFLQVLEMNQDPQDHSNKQTRWNWLADEITAKGKPGGYNQESL